VARNVLGAR